MERPPIRLRVLLHERGWQRYSSFVREYRRAAKAIDPDLIEDVPSRAQLHRWLSGELKRLPYADHCRVLEAMLPGWSAQQMFQAINSHASTGDPTSIERTQVMPGLAAIDPQRVAGEFESFVGAEIATHGVTLVYPTFGLSEEARSVLGGAGIPRQHIYAKKRSVFRSNRHRIDVPEAVAANDVRALIYVSSLLQRHAAISFDIQDDYKVVEQCDRALISFGFSSNDCTHMYLQRSANPLFSIRDDPDEKSYLEYLQLADGTSFRSTDDVNIGIIARVRPDPVHQPERRWFYCAGLGPRGTAGAAWLFASHWRELHKQGGRNDFIAVLSVQSYSDQTARLEHIYAPEKEGT